jgi:hypothetical protein
MLVPARVLHVAALCNQQRSGADVNMTKLHFEAAVGTRVTVASVSYS